MMVQVSADQRERLAMSTEKLNQSSERIKESRRTMLETEELGVSILQDLHQQRQTLLHAHEKVCCSLDVYVSSEVLWAMYVFFSFLSCTAKSNCICFPIHFLFTCPGT